MTPVRDEARGRWAAILPALGVESRFLQNRAGPCPICKAGTDRFRFDDKDGDGTFYCNQCGAGDGLRLVMLVNGWDFKEAANEVRKLAGTAPVQLARPKPMDDPATRREILNTVWRSGRPLRESPAALKWWAMRCGNVPLCNDLRGIDRLRYNTKGEAPTYHPGLLALVRNAAGEPAALHRTYLTVAGKKADLALARKALGPIPHGSAVRLSEPVETLGIAEGLETAFSATLLCGAPCWAALTADNLARWNPPVTVKRVVIFGDADVSFTGQAVAYALARRLSAPKTVEVEVRIPELKRGVKSTDWNDVLLAKMERDQPTLVRVRETEAA